MPPGVSVPKPGTGSLLMAQIRPFAQALMHSLSAHYVAGALGKPRGDLNMFSGFQELTGWC